MSAPARAALVTGSAANIGRAIALGLAADGHAVMVHARASREAAQETVRLIREAGGRAELTLADIAVQEEARRLVEATQAAFGRIDTVVNNASARRQTPVEDISAQEWRQILGATLDGSFFVSQAAVPHLAASGAGTLVMLGGMAGHTGARHRVHAVTAKAAIVGLTKALAVELSDRGVCVNCVVPGTIATVRGASAGALPQLPDNLAGRMGAPEEIAAMVRFLAGPGARYVTGQTLHVNGGAYLP